MGVVSHARRAAGNRVWPANASAEVAVSRASGYGAGVLAVPHREIQALLLDLGNTLVGMDADLVSDLLGREGIRCPPDRFRRVEAAARPALSAWIARPTSDEPTTLVYVREMLAQLGVDAGERAELARRLVARLRGVPTQRLWSAILPGVPEALARLRGGGLRLVVVSNSDGTAEGGMVDLGLRPLVDAVVDSAIFGGEKPDPRIFAHALELAGVRPAQGLHVGDLYAVDVIGARAAGAHATLLDPFGDWRDLDCEVATDLGALADRMLGARR
jgi:putative hydrolase of the HAD superfamily